jgi:outer membrane protein assembly factor BamB
MHWMRVVAVVFALFIFGNAGQALGSEPEITNSGGNLRTGWYPDASGITPSMVSGSTFGRLWSAPVEGQVYAQPLLANGTLLVATEKNRVYGLNPATGAMKWSKSLGEPWDPEEIGCGDLTPQIGVTATPVVDPSTGTVYLTHKTYAPHSSEVRWYMDALNVATGAEQPGFPVELSGEAQNAEQTFEPQKQLQRPGLLLLEGVVYAGFGSDCDIDPYQGWIFGVSTTGAVKARWTSEAEGWGSGIWQSGAGIVSDGPGTLMVVTGNGGVPNDHTPGSKPPGNLGESIVRLRVEPGGSLQAVDFFSPFNAAELAKEDIDFASSGVAGLPGEYFGTPSIPHLAVAAGKEGYVYLVNRDELGGAGEGPGGSDKIVQRIFAGGVWSRPGVWPGEGGWVYIPTASAGNVPDGTSGNLLVYQYAVSKGLPTLSLKGTSSDAFGFSSGAPVITSEAATPGSALVWIIWAPNGSGVGAQLRAYNPVPEHEEPVLRWSAPIGTSAKFATPGVGDGRLYVGTRDGHVLAFGAPVTAVLSGPSTEFPTTTIGQSSVRTVTLTATEPLTVSKLVSNSAQFKLGPVALPAELTTGQTIEVPITFTPTSSGPLGATLTATTDTGNAEFSLSGAGLAPTGQLEVMTPVVSFPATTVGGSVSAGAIFRNVGGAPLTLESVSLPAAPFEASGIPALNTTVSPGGSITIPITFRPSAAGVANGEVAIRTNVGTGVVHLSGTAGPPPSLQGGNQIPGAEILGFQAEALAIRNLRLVATSMTASQSGTISLKVSCPTGVSRCAGTITVRTLAAVVASGSKSHKVMILTLATGSFVIAGGRVTTVKLHLTGKGRALLARKHVLRARVIILAHGATGASQTSRTIVTVRAPKPKPGPKG